MTEDVSQSHEKESAVFNIKKIKEIILKIKFDDDEYDDAELINDCLDVLPLINGWVNASLEIDDVLTHTERRDDKTRTRMNKIRTNVQTGLQTSMYFFSNLTSIGNTSKLREYYRSVADTTEMIKTNSRNAEDEIITVEDRNKKNTLLIQKIDQAVFNYIDELYNLLKQIHTS